MFLSAFHLGYVYQGLTEVYGIVCSENASERLPSLTPKDTLATLSLELQKHRCLGTTSESGACPGSAPTEQLSPRLAQRSFVRPDRGRVRSSGLFYSHRMYSCTHFCPHSVELKTTSNSAEQHFQLLRTLSGSSEIPPLGSAPKQFSSVFTTDGSVAERTVRDHSRLPWTLKPYLEPKLSITTLVQSGHAVRMHDCCQYSRIYQPVLRRVIVSFDSDAKGDRQK